MKIYYVTYDYNRIPPTLPLYPPDNLRRGDYIIGWGRFKECKKIVEGPITYYECVFASNDGKEYEFTLLKGQMLQLVNTLL